MPLPDDLLPRLGESSFWARYVFEDEEDDGLAEDEGEAVEFMLDDRHGLVLHMDLSLDLHSLMLTAPGLASPAEVAWNA